MRQEGGSKIQLSYSILLQIGNPKNWEARLKDFRNFFRNFFDLAEFELFIDPV